MLGMEKRRLGKTGLQVSVIGFGSAPVGYLDESLANVERILNLLLDAGVNLLDTAACYPHAEEMIGATVSHRRNEYYLVTKCGHQGDGLTEPEWSPELIEKSIDRSLRRLHTDYLDVVLLHSCDQSVLEQGDAVEALVKARDAGKTRFIGYSGDNEAAAFAAQIPEFSVLQTSVNICDQRNIDVALPKAVEHDLGVLAKRPLANAAWKAPGMQRGVYQSYSEPYSRRLAAMGIDPGLFGFNGLRNEEFPRLALRFTLTVPGVHCALIGTTNPANALRNLEIAEEGPLPVKTYEAIRRAFREAEKRSGTVWLGLT
ncbi:MAG: aldo/keto reductase [Acidobacteriota bacterium]